MKASQYYIAVEFVRNQALELFSVLTHRAGGATLWGAGAGRAHPPEWRVRRAHNHGSWGHSL